MRHGAPGRRSRNRGQNRRGGGGHNPNRVQVFDSNGPDVRIRGTAHQIHEKYATLAKDATSAGDIVLAESYLQHAEHYQRMITGWIDFVDGRSDYYMRQRTEWQDDGVSAVDGAEASETGEDLGLPASIIERTAVVDAVRTQKQLEEV